MPNRDLDITVDLAKGKTGNWIGSMSVLGSTSIDVPLGNIAVKDTEVGFTATLPQSASFEGKLSENAEALTGKASNADGAVDFQLARRGEANVKVPPPSSKSSKNFEGTWEATVNKEDGTARRLSLKLSPAPDGTAAATLTRLAPSKMEIPISTVTIRNKQLELESRAVSGSYRGTLGGSGEIIGEWIEGSAHAPVTFKRASSETKAP